MDESVKLQRAFEELVGRILTFERRLDGIEQGLEGVQRAMPPNPTGTLKGVAAKLEQLDGTTGNLGGAVGRVRHALDTIGERLDRIERRPDETLAAERNALGALLRSFEKRLGELVDTMRLARTQRRLAWRTAALTTLALCTGLFALTQFGQWLSPITWKARVAATVAGDWPAPIRGSTLIVSA